MHFLHLHACFSRRRHTFAPLQNHLLQKTKGHSDSLFNKDVQSGQKAYLERERRESLLHITKESGERDDRTSQALWNGGLTRFHFVTLLKAPPDSLNLILKGRNPTVHSVAKSSSSLPSGKAKNQCILSQVEESESEGKKVDERISIRLIRLRLHSHSTYFFATEPDCTYTFFKITGRKSHRLLVKESLCLCLLLWLALLIDQPKTSFLTTSFEERWDFQESANQIHGWRIGTTTSSPFETN